MLYVIYGRRGYEPKVVWGLIATNFAVFIAECIYPPTILLLALVPSKILRGEALWTLITHMFVHAGLLHIFLNMYALFIFGPECEREFGRVKFLFLYFMSGVSGALLHSVLTPMKDVPAVGASGAIFGIMAAYAALYPKRKLAFFFFVGFIILPAWALVLIFAVLETLYFVAGVIDYVAHLAHLGGLIFGLLFALAYKKLHMISVGGPYFYEVVTTENYEYW